MATAQYKTLLDQLVQQNQRTIDETCVAFAKKARELGESATLSERQLQRWIRGDVGQARPVSRRVAEAYWGYSFDQLMGPPTISSELGRLNATPAPSPSVDVNSLEAAALMAAHESYEHAASTAGNVDPMDVEFLQESVYDLARAYQKTPPLQLMLDARHVRDVAYALLDRTRKPAQTADLYLTAAQACGLMSVVSFDLTQWAAAEEQARAAHTYAELVGHSGMRAWARGTQALIANWRGQPRRAAELIARSVGEAPSGAATARLRSIEARAWAALGRPDQVTESLRLADLAMNSPQTDDLYDGTGGEFAWSQSRHAACAGTALLTVGKPELAVQRLGQAIELIPGDPWGGLEPARSQVDLATAELVAGRLDASVAALDAVWTVPAPKRRHALIGRMDVLARQLTGPTWRDATEAGRLRDQIEVFSGEAASRLSLPSA